MDINIAIILVILSLLTIVLLLYLLPIDQSNDKLQLEGRLDQLVKSISGLDPLLRQIAELTQNHENILSGAKLKGDLGEQLVGERLADLPLEWYQRNVLFSNGTTVEFALRAPNKRWVPIDSQWTATRLLDQLGRATRHSHRNAFREQVHIEVTKRAKEARKYVDKDCTLGFCIVAVPDPVFELSVDIQAELTSSDIVLISHSLLVPFILLIVNQYLKTPDAAEALRIGQILTRFSSQIEVIQKYINEEVTPPLRTVMSQQAQHVRRNRGIDHVHGSVDEIQSELNIMKSELNEIQSELYVVRNMFIPVHSKDIDSIPKNLQRYLNLVQKGLLEAIAKQNGHSPNSVDNEK